MEFAKKYALVPEDMFSKHVPNKKQMTEFDREMSNILNSSLDDYEKVQRYYELLQKKMNIENFNLPWKTSTSNPEKEPPKTKSTEEPKASEEEDDDYTLTVLNSVPTSLKKQAEGLLHILKKHSDILTWNKHGEITYKDRKHDHSNLADLIGMILTNRKNIHIKGKEDFLSALNEMNAPRLFIKNKHLSTVEEPVIKKEELPRAKYKKSKRVASKWDSF